MTPPRPSRAAIDAALSVLRAKERELLSLARCRQDAAASYPWLPDVPRWRRSAKRDAAAADLLDEAIAWMERQRDG